MDYNYYKRFRALLQAEKTNATTTCATNHHTSSTHNYTSTRATVLPTPTSGTTRFQPAGEKDRGTFPSSPPSSTHSIEGKTQINRKILSDIIQSNTKPVHSIHPELNCPVITFGRRAYLLDEADELAIVSSAKKFILTSPFEVYPYYREQGKQINYLHFLYNKEGKQVRFTFQNGNDHDLRRSNVNVASVGGEEPIQTQPAKRARPNEPFVPTFTKNEELDCYNICGGNVTYLVDRDDYQKIMNVDRGFQYDASTDEYPYYKNSNGKRVSYFEIIFSVSPLINRIKHKNNNKRDLRRSNVEISPHHFAGALEGYEVIEYLGGHSKQFGIKAGLLLNPKWKVREADGTESIALYCEPGVICLLCEESYRRVVQFQKEHNEGVPVTWHAHSNGYIQGCFVGKKTLYIHQIILNCFGNGKGTSTISVDHIDRNQLNNKLSNLRTANMVTQQQNTKGILPGTLRARSSQKELPEGLTYDMLHKFVYYNSEVYNKEENKTREFFRVEHPNLPHPWSTTKSGKVSIQEKLTQANRVADDVVRGILPQNITKSITITTAPTTAAAGVGGGGGGGGGGACGVGVTKTILEDVTRPLGEGKETIALPKYVYFTVAREKPHLLFDKRTEDARMNIRMVLPSKAYLMSEQLEILNKKIVDKYGEAHKVL